MPCHIHHSKTVIIRQFLAYIQGWFTSSFLPTLLYMCVRSYNFEFASIFKVCQKTHRPWKVHGNFLGAIQIILLRNDFKQKAANNICHHRCEIINHHDIVLYHSCGEDRIYFPFHKLIVFFHTTAARLWRPILSGGYKIWTLIPRDFQQNMRIQTRSDIIYRAFDLRLLPAPIQEPDKYGHVRERDLCIHARIWLPGCIVCTVYPSDTLLHCFIPIIISAA